jgi:hypothetical protein
LKEFRFEAIKIEHRTKLRADETFESVFQSSPEREVGLHTEGGNTGREQEKARSCTKTRLVEEVGKTRAIRSKKARTDQSHIKEGK